ncbi:MAG: PTPA-CTERM sorting domain-containing protein [Nodosilinea sp.]
MINTLYRSTLPTTFVPHGSVANGTPCTHGQRATGQGVFPVPTPALLPGLVGLGLAALRRQQDGDRAT